MVSLYPMSESFVEIIYWIQIVLLLDNAPANFSISTLQSNDCKVVTKFLPPNTTSLIQPMDQGILESVKRRYKKSLLCYFWGAKWMFFKDHSRNYEGVNHQRCIWVAQSWDEISQETLMNGWNKLPQKPGFPPSGSSSWNPELSVHDTTEFGELFDFLGWTEGDDNWQSPDDWLHEDTQILTISYWTMKEL